MQKIITLLLATTISITLPAQNRLFDQQMVIKQMNIRVNADCFTATTFIEMVFYNPKDKEIEGLYRFKLDKGQAITAFQLDLHGKYREGSIEEKWKARGAYNSIVGKRIDPAVVQYDHNGNYRISVYPVPAKSSRKITMTIQQLLKQENDHLEYHFPLNQNDLVENLNLSISVNGCGMMPLNAKGLIANDYFSFNGSSYDLKKHAKEIKLPDHIGFSLPLKKGFNYYSKTIDGKTFYALRMDAGLPSSYSIQPKKLLVYWDVSGSAAEREISKEISFLKHYIDRHKISELSVVAFAGQTYAKQIFNPLNSRAWMQYLQSFTFDGTTRYDHLNLSDSTADVIFLFSDGVTSIGNKHSPVGKNPVFTISSSQNTNKTALQVLTGNSGGKLIDLKSLPVSNAVNAASEVAVHLLRVETDRSSNYQFLSPPIPGEIVSLYGDFVNSNKLRFVYGNNQRLFQAIDIELQPGDSCPSSAIDRMDMLNHFTVNDGWQGWEEKLEFGLKEKVVTARTSFIVLERIEDYIKYNISPPKELEQECIDRGYVKQNTKSWRQQLKDKDDFDILTGVVNAYNHRLSEINPHAVPIGLQKWQFDVIDKSTAASGSDHVNVNDALSGTVSGLVIGDGQQSLQEVVVVSYGMVRKRAMTSSFMMFNRRELGYFSMPIENVLAGRVAGLQITRTHDGVNPGVSVHLRGTTSLSGNNQPLYVIDGMPVEGDVNTMVAAHDIEHIVVLKDASASAIYGSRAVNGVIVITTKKYNPYRYGYYEKPRAYKLKDMEDEVWVQEIHSVSAHEKVTKYLELKKNYGSHALFYIEVAQDLYAFGLKKFAIDVLMNASEISGGDDRVLTAIGFVLEEWKEYVKASEVYDALVQKRPSNIDHYRNLAWSYYLQDSVQKAVDLLYAAIKINLESSEYYMQGVKAHLLMDMNAMIAIHGEKLDLTQIPSAIIKPVHADLRIVLSGNTRSFTSEIKEPGKLSAKKLKRGYNNYYSNYLHDEYTAVHASTGKYKVFADYYGGYENELPEIIRIVTYRNFGTKEQSVSVQNVVMNNQRGKIEIGEVELK